MGERYCYRAEMKQDIREWIDENIELKDWAWNRNGLEGKLRDDMWDEDSITGNGSGSYTFSTYKAEENICHNLDLLYEACEEFESFDVLRKGAEACDVTIRCYLLAGCISDVLDELEENGEFDEDEEESEEE